APLVCAAFLFLLPVAVKCGGSYGRVCIQNPEFTSRAAAGSLQMGLTTFRVYWSSRSRWESTIVLPEDWSMVEHWGTACDIGRISTPGQWLRCTFSRPLYLPVYLGKKVIAVFDHLFLQPYAADVTPAWAMDYGRVFSAL